ncbi:MAG TPA: hypothetical protein VMF67_19235 [Rhizomicrobium sp.]|nr:hypothetical protein [Rhizomicrobium sp.]
MRIESIELPKFRMAWVFGAGFHTLLCISVLGAAQAAPASKAATARFHASWRAAITSTALPGEGCFTATYPATSWTQVACTEAPDRAFEPAHRPAVGFGDDYAAMVSGSTTAAVGSFPAITGLTSEKSADVSNQYSLQMNVPYFNSPACDSSPYPPGCEAWQQFVFSQSGGKAGTPSAFMVYWLINYGPYCPSGWSQAALNCWINSSAVGVPHQKLAAVRDLQLSGSAASGGDDAVKITTSKKAYAVSAADSALDLAGSWKGTEFNILGDGAGSQANFNTGTNITVNVQLTDGSTTAPGCKTNEIFTYETNNLSLGSCTSQGGQNPSITFTESD